MTIENVTLDGQDPVAQRIDIACVADPNGFTVVVAGEIDSFSVPVLAASLAGAATATDGLIIVDLGAVSFIDSSGITALVTAQNTAAGRLRLDPIPPPVHRILEITGLLDHFSGSSGPEPEVPPPHRDPPQHEPVTPIFPDTTPPEHDPETPEVEPEPV